MSWLWVVWVGSLIYLVAGSGPALATYVAGVAVAALGLGIRYVVAAGIRALNAPESGWSLQHISIEDGEECAMVALPERDPDADRRAELAAWNARRCYDPGRCGCSESDAR